ncbi:MAG: decarboxylating 6-phosphogluconate dehydrogenase [Candidatus Taylorbacteria bacterium]|nr:decarboxylating 6-phosphogluconate dehydrogenase [Candidatus Taylorbacteria bacterium]
MKSLTIFGLGRMGGQIARRLSKKGFRVYAWNRSEEPVKELRKRKVWATQSIEEAVAKSGKSRIFWVMLPHAVVDDFLFGPDQLGKFLKKGDIVIDGGNSHYKDTLRRAKEMEKKGIHFFDCGTSGGVWGEKEGFALMIGGPKAKWKAIEPFMKALSAGDNYAHLGKSGAGHFTKMVHNGIEYGMMEAIGEGYAVLEASEFDLDLAAVTRVYQKGSVVRSWLIDLVRNIFEDEDVDATSGKIDATGEGEWTVLAGKELGVDVRVIESSLAVRRESADPKNQGKFSNKIVALLRKQFGGHKAHSAK